MEHGIDPLDAADEIILNDSAHIGNCEGDMVDAVDDARENDADDDDDANDLVSEGNVDSLFHNVS